MVRRSAVNRKIVGSSPTRAANKKQAKGRKMDKMKIYAFIYDPSTDVERTIEKDFSITKEDWEDRDGITFLNKALHKILIENGYNPNNKAYRYYRSYEIVENISGYDYI